MEENLKSEIKIAVLKPMKLEFGHNDHLWWWQPMHKTFGYLS